MKVRLAGNVATSRDNGPGRRAVVWFQGCSLACPGCFNPHTHSSTGGYEASTQQLAGDILSRRESLEGVTLSGGEPLEQPEALLDLLQRLSGTGLSTLLFTGLDSNELRSHRLGPLLLSHLDVAICGRFVASLSASQGRPQPGLVASTNQEVVFVTQRYADSDLDDVPTAEAIVDADGQITLTGIAPLRFATRQRHPSR